MKCLLVASESAEYPAFEDSFNTLFAPLISSCSTLIEKINDTYTSLITENTHLYILHQFAECLNIAVNGDGEESEEDLRRKIYVMKKLIELSTQPVCSSGGSISIQRAGGTPQSPLPQAGNQMAEDSLKTLEAKPPDPATPRRVFLEATFKEGSCPMMPHSMYCLPLWPGISMVLLTKIPNSQVAMSLYQFLEAFTMLEKKLSEGQEGGSLPRTQTPATSWTSSSGPWAAMRCRYHPELQNIWTDFKNKAFSRAAQGTSRELLMSCRAMKTRLCAVYRQYFVVQSHRSPQRLSVSLQEKSLAMMQEKLYGLEGLPVGEEQKEHHHGVISCQSRSHQLWGPVGTYTPIVATGSVFSLTPSCTYLEAFPGLVHFIYMDRTAGQMIAPSLNVTDLSTTELGKGPLAHFIKSKVWSLVGTARRYLQKGYTTVTLRDGDYYFCYFLWFESETVGLVFF
ncbi:UNVERIFIED_CONTAM: hypothetical protein FKN15_028611 [Acipenser sinensis]